MRTSVMIAILTAGWLAQAACGASSFYFSAQSWGNGSSEVAVDIRHVTDTAEFRAALGPHGAWFYLHPYGWVWQPNVAVRTKAWQPYCHGGRWVWTAYGWYWQSDYSWGWAPFHYGRWLRSAHRGWLWVPDTAWAPAWVHWRYSSKHLGWAPLPPGTHFEVGVGLYFGDSPAGPTCTFGLGYEDYIFIEGDDLLSGHLSVSVISRGYYPSLYSRTSVSYGFEYHGGTIVHYGPPPCSPKPPPPQTVVYQTVYAPPPVYYAYPGGYYDRGYHGSHHGSPQKGNHSSGHQPAPPPVYHSPPSGSSGQSHHSEPSHHASPDKGHGSGTPPSAPPPNNVSPPPQKSQKTQSARVSQSAGRRSQRVKQIVKRR